MLVRCLWFRNEAPISAPRGGCGVCVYRDGVRLYAATGRRIGNGVAPASAVTDSAVSVAAISRLWAAYLSSKGGRFAANAGTPSALWLAAEQARWSMYDLAGFYLPDDAVPSVLRIRPVSPGARDAFEIVTRFLLPGARSADSGSSPAFTTTVDAVRDHGEWLLGNALPRKTARWRRETVGPITYVVQPSLAFDRARARRAAAFVDSLAGAFGLSRLVSLDYYVTSSVDTALSILGIEASETYGTHGGFSKPVNHQLFSGDPALGENYRHELTHVTLLPLVQRSGTTLLASEGVATWLGGTEGTDFHGAVRNLARYLAAHPRVTLDSLVDTREVPQSVTYSAGAVLCEMLSEAGGVAAIKSFLIGGGASDVRVVLVRLLGRPWPAIVADWRTAVDRLGSG